jgi:hypothetical protein
MSTGLTLLLVNKCVDGNGTILFCRKTEPKKGSIEMQKQI